MRQSRQQSQYQLRPFERRRTQRKGTRFDLNWWIGGPTTWVTFVLSAFSTWHTVVYYSDHLTVLSSPASFHKNGATGEVTVRPPKNIVFLNSGTRQSAVLDVQLVFFLRPVPPSQVSEGSAKSKTNCQPQDSGEWFGTTFVRTVVDAHHITTHHVKFPRPDTNVSGYGSRPLRINNGDIDAKWIGACAKIDFLAGDSPFTKMIEINVVDDSIAIPSTLPPDKIGPAVDLIKRDNFGTEVAADTIPG